MTSAATLGDCVYHVHLEVYVPISGSDLSRLSLHLLSQPLPIRRQPGDGLVFVPRGLKTMLNHLVLSIAKKTLQVTDTHK